MFSKALSSFTSNISSNYSISAQSSSTSGPWKIFDAKRKSSGKPASVFVFDQKSLVPQGGSLHGGRSGGTGVKRAHEEVVERLKKEASSLARLRHPSILELQEPVEETRSGGLMFATEPVTASLGQLLQDKDDQERSGGVGGRGSRYVVEEANGTRSRRELEIDELEIQKGLLQLGKGLDFLHESAGLVHGNLTPEAILVNAKGDWKISGLAFCGPHENSTAATSLASIQLSEVLNHDPRLPRTVQLNLDYTSPDFVLDNNLNPSADMFSLGLIIVTLYNSPHTSPISVGGSLSSYKRVFANSSTIPTQNNNFLVPSSHTLPPKLVSDLLPRLITRRPAQRLSAKEFQDASYFDNILVSTIRFLDALPAKTPNEKAAFMRGLPRIMPQFPKSVLEKKVLPALLEEMKDKELLAPIMTNIFAMVKTMPTGKRAFSTIVVPKLREVFITNRSAEKDTSKEAGIMILLENMETAASNSTGKEFRDDILPIILLALESPTHGLVDAALGTLPSVLPVLDFSTIKNELFPVIANVFAKTSSLAIKIRGLEAFYTLCGGTATTSQDDDLNGIGVSDKKSSANSSAILDKFTVQEKVVPLMKGIKTKEPGVMMAALKVFKQVGEVADTDYLAMDVLPILWSMSLGPLLNLQQFQAFMTLIKSLGGRIEREQERKLRDMGASGNASVGTGARRTPQPGSAANAINGLSNGEETDFESLVSGRKTANGNNDDLMNDWGVPAATSVASARPAIGSRQASASRIDDSPKFSWQSSGMASMSSMSSQGQASSLNALRGQAGIGRTVTPDHSLTSFASFASLTPASPWSQPLQPVTSPPASTTSFSTNSIPMRPSIPTPQQSSGGGTNIDWSAASMQQQRPMQQRAASGFGLPPPPMSPQSVGGFGGVPGQQQQKLAQQPPPPSAAGAGLDKYASLL
ncbi:kinase-like protein [Teratosphaeria nubilosa]|uniref:Kinase-like protein n=1 Tax=Teratosphaeria nubilosa TaxID=161662 RepID=A0A6G1L5A4_9PEZI|nr:kinase-like protein [Teratosphaeria nubilosa]